MTELLAAWAALATLAAIGYRNLWRQAAADLAMVSRWYVEGGKPLLVPHGLVRFDHPN